MINILRSATPQHLDTTVRNLSSNDYKDPQVVQTLLAMQHLKCCFCEKYLPVLGRTAKWVEHFIAKKDDTFKNAAGEINWNEANKWTNLLYSCSTCNRTKGTEKPFSNTGVRRLIDPSYSRINPENHIDFFIDGTAITYIERKQSALGKRTILNLKLKARADIYASLRIVKIEVDQVFSEYINYLVDQNVAAANSKLLDLRKMSSAHNTHASFRRKYIKIKVDKFNNTELAVINQNLAFNLVPLNINLAVGHENIIN